MRIVAIASGSERRQSTEGNNETVPDSAQNRRDGSWGDKLLVKKAGMCRILLQNPGGIGVTPGVKFGRLMEYLKENKVDITGISEVNVNWKLMTDGRRLGDRTRGIFESQRVISSYYRKDNSALRDQPGGTAMMAVNKLSYCVQSTGQDKRGMGRWCWIRLRGKGGVQTRLITVYVPTKNAGENTVYAQQIRGLAVFKISDCPIKQLWSDLKEEIRAWRAAGEQIIVLGDFNEDTRQVENRLEEFSLKDVIRGRHGQDSPATFQRGSRAIDGILATPTIAAEMLKAGYLPFGELLGDHRGLWLDIPLPSILGYSMAEVKQYQARRLKLEDPRVVRKYQQSLLEYCARHDMYRRIDSLRRKAIYPLPPALQRVYEVLDKLRIQGMEWAELKCRKLHMGVYPWSPEFTAARDTVYLWILVIKRLSGCHVHASKIIKLRKRLGIVSTNVDMAEAGRFLDAAYKAYKEIKTKSHTLRASHQEALAKAKANQGNTSVVSQLKSLEHRENQRRRHRTIRAVTREEGNTGTTKVEIVNEDGTKEELTERKDLEKAIMKENESKYHQIDNSCPLTKGQLLRDIGWYGEGPKVDDILNGTYVPPVGTDAETKEFLDEIGRNGVPQIPKQSIHEFRSSWNVSREKTASGGIHFGHFMACSRNNNLNWINFAMAEIPEISGYAPIRYKKVVDLMLLKEPNNFLLQKLRTIVLFQADSNMTNKRLGRESMWSAVKHGHIAEEQYSRPRRKAIDHALNRRLVFDISRQQRSPLAMCSCDLKNNYDRIAHNAASLALQRVGVPRSKIISMFTTIQDMVHTVRTLFGDADQSYGGDTSEYLKPPQGACQGNGAGPAMWAILSSTVFAIMRRQGYGVKFCSALSRELYHLCGFAYVDDSDLIQSGSCPMVIAADMQKALGKWEKLMRVNGGVLAPDKSWWYLVEFVWSKGKWTYNDAGETVDLKAQDMHGKTLSLKYLLHNEAKEMLGVFLAPDGNNVAQLEKMTKTRDNWMDKFRFGVLEPEDHWMAFGTRIFKKLEYPLPALTLTRDECDKLMSPLLQQTLSFSGVCRTISKEVRHGPVNRGGLGLPDLFIRQGCMRVQTMVEHLWLQTPTGKLIKIAMEGLKLEVGISSTLFDRQFSVYGKGLNTSTWLSHTWEFMSEHDISYVEPLGNLETFRQHDQCIMDVLLTEGYTTIQCMTLNRCRMFLHVLNLSEIANVEGTKLLPGSLTGDKRPCLNKRNWPAQQTPPRTEWRLWELAVTKAFASADLLLTDPMGHWNTADTLDLDGWDWWLSQDRAQLFHQTVKGLWQVHDAQSSSRRVVHFSITSQPAIVRPSSSTMVTVTTSIDRITVKEVERQHTSHHHLGSPKGLKRRVMDAIVQHPDGGWVAETLKSSASLDVLEQDLASGKAVAVSDGSYHPDLSIGSHAWTIEAWDSSEFIAGSGMVPGMKSDQNSYRSEIAGQYGIAVATSALAGKDPSNRHSRLICACDGESALGRCHLPVEKITASMKQFDLISSTAQVWSESGIEVTPVHVHGHRDDTGDDLNRLEKMNVEMDGLAKETLSKFILSGRNLPVRSRIRPGMGSVFVGTTEIHSKLQGTLEWHIQATKMELYWLRRRPCFKSEPPDWYAYERARKEAPFYTRHFISKWSSGFLPTNKVMVRRKERTFTKCHMCGHYMEDNLHVATCWHRASRKVWKGLLTELERWLDDKQTEAILKELIIDGLSQWRDKPHADRDYFCYLDLKIRRSARAIHKRGWLTLLEGFLDPMWKHRQQAYYNLLESRRSGQRWAIDLTRQLWNMLLQLWLHRNRALHDRDIAQKDLNGWPLLEHAVNIECTRGLDSLPEHFSIFFKEEPDIILARPLDKVKRWYSIVKGGREMTGTDWPNIFSCNSAERKWVGLYPIE